MGVKHFPCPHVGSLTSVSDQPAASARAPSPTRRVGRRDTESAHEPGQSAWPCEQKRMRRRLFASFRAGFERPTRSPRIPKIPWVRSVSTGAREEVASFRIAGVGRQTLPLFPKPPWVRSVDSEVASFRAGAPAAVPRPSGSQLPSYVPQFLQVWVRSAKTGVERAFASFRAEGEIRRISPRIPRSPLGSFSAGVRPRWLRFARRACPAPGRGGWGRRPRPPIAGACGPSHPDAALRPLRAQPHGGWRCLTMDS